MCHEDRYRCPLRPLHRRLYDDRAQDLMSSSGSVVSNDEDSFEADSSGPLNTGIPATRAIARPGSGYRWWPLRYVDDAVTR